MTELVKDTQKFICKFDSSRDEICLRFKLSAQALALLNESLTKEDFLQQLINKHFYSDAVNFLAHALPKRESIWWAYLCVDAVEQLSVEKNQAVIEILQLIKTWIYRPQETVRRKIEPFTEQFPSERAISWVALAVFWSGGSITPLGKPEVQPVDYLYAKAVAGAIMLAATVVPEKLDQHYQYFLSQGLDIAKGGSGVIEWAYP